MRPFLLVLTVWLACTNGAALAGESDWVTVVFPERAL